MGANQYQVNRLIRLLVEINLRDTREYRHEFDNKEETEADFVAWGVKFAGMQKTLVVRSPNVLKNKSGIDYWMRIREEGQTSESEEQIIKLKDGQCFPIPSKEEHYRKKF